MVNSCFVRGCKFKTSNRKSSPNTENVSLHRFPSEARHRGLREAWIAAVGRIPNRNSCICSQHFKMEDMDYTGQTRRLRDGVVPSIFPVLSHEEVELEAAHQLLLLGLNTHPEFSSTLSVSDSTDTSNISDMPIHSVSGLETETDSSVLISYELSSSHDTERSAPVFHTDAEKSDTQAHSVSVSSETSHKLLDMDLELETEANFRILCVEETECEISGDSAHLTENLETPLTVMNTEIDTCTKSSSKDVIEEDTPRKRKLKQQLGSARKKIKRLQQKVRRQVKIIKTNKEIIDRLLSENLLTKYAAEILEKTLPPGTCSLVKRAIKNKNKKDNSNYDPDLRSFALTLHYFSPKAYEFVRCKFNKSLPNSRTIRTWYMKIDCEPGLSVECFNAIEQKANEARKKEITPTVCLSIDDMSIKEHIEPHRGKVVGYIDLGTEIQDENLPTAKMACVIMCTAINMSFKIPCGFFFIESLTGAERARLISSCIEKLHEQGVVVAALTFDGASSNLSMSNTLGADLNNVFHPKVYFPHPVEPEKKVYVLLDACHMVKLVRNCLAEKQILYSNGQPIKWCYIEALSKLQCEEGLHLGNKLSARHMNWRKRKMNVRLAVQTLSNSVAAAIDFCNKNLHLPEFEGSEETVKFIRLVDKMFDLLNSSSVFGRNFKAPLRCSNEENWRPFIDEALRYLDGLSTSPVRNEPVLLSNRKIGFLGFKVSLLSAQNIFEEYIAQDPSKYLLTYKLSQDHVELFFSLIRQRGGWNNNPTCRQFMSAFKRLTVRNELKEPKSGNCLTQSNIPMLYVTSTSTGRSRQFIETDDCVPFTSLVNIDHDYIPSVSSLSLYAEKVIEYVAGCVVRCVLKVLACNPCKTALVSTGKKYDFIDHRNNGGLISPSDDVTAICKMTERCYRASISPNLNSVLEKKIPILIAQEAAQFGIFDSLSSHTLDLDPLDTHINNLVKLVSSTYQKIRLYHTVQERNCLSTDHRSTYNRLAIFKHL